jgi:membrane protein required for colicin V production
MAKYDVLLIVVLVLATLRGAWKGMAWQIASLASLGVSFFVAAHYSDLLAPYLSAEAPWNKFLAMLVLYLGSSLAIWAGFSVVSKFIERVQLREFDRQVGGLFGLARGLLYCIVITFFAVTLSEQGRAAVLESQSGYYIAVLIHRATPIIPAEARELLGPYLDQLQRGLDPRQPAIKK